MLVKDASTTWSLASIFTVCASGAVSVYPGTCAPASSSVIVHEVPTGSCTLDRTAVPSPLAFTVPVVALASSQV